MLRTPRCDTVSALFLRSLQWRGRAPMFVDEHDRFDGPQALQRACRLAAAYQRLGATRGAVVAYLCKPSARHAVAWLAAPLAGRVACNLHVRETPQRLGEVLHWLGATVLVHDDDLAPLARAACAVAGAAGTVCARVVLQPGDAAGAAASADAVAVAGAGADVDAGFDRLADAEHFDALCDSEPPLDVLADAPRPDDLAAIILSSGSTGQPKGIMHTQHTMLEAAKGGQHAFGSVTPHDAVLMLMQPSFAAWVIISLPFIGGKGKICYGSQFDPKAFLATLERERITLAPLVPTMWRRVFAEDTSRHDLSAVRVSTISGEPPAASDIVRLREQIAPGVTSLYLSSEAFTATSVVAFTEDLLDPKRVAASGRPGVGVDVKIIDPAGGFDDEMPAGQAGEIAVSGPSLAVGYWKDPQLTAQRFRDGWWRSGDLGRIDDEGHLWVLGRIDNVINSGGIKVPGEEIERALLGHPAVEQCAVLGVADERLGQRIEAWLVCRGTLPTDAELAAHCRGAGGLAGFKVPKAFHIVDALPTGPTGKLFRRGLRSG